MESFEAVWEYLQKNLKVGTEIRNWTADKGFLDDSMTIKSVTNLAIDVETPNAKYVQSVPRENFETVFKVWEEYKAKSIRRHDIRDMTRFSKYILSILKWREMMSSDESV
jgi:hypothetical protein